MLTYKEVELHELPQVANMYNLLAYEMIEITSDPYFNFDTLSDKTFLNHLSEAVQEKSLKIFIAKEDNDVVGFISGTITNCFLPMSNVGKIGSIEAAFVVKQYRKNGVMTVLEETITKHFKNCGLEYVELHVLSGNERARNFWSKSGYVTFREQRRKRL